MNYLITGSGEPFYTNWFDFENNYVPGMVVFNLLTCQHTFDGVTWEDTQEDHL
jgi:hypothetical protein